eukprot:6454154-Prymnesium_polylepis.1
MVVGGAVFTATVGTSVQSERGVAHRGCGRFLARAMRLCARWCDTGGGVWCGRRRGLWVGWRGWPGCGVLACVRRGDVARRPRALVDVACRVEGHIVLLVTGPRTQKA